MSPRLPETITHNITLTRNTSGDTSSLQDYSFSPPTLTNTNRRFDVLIDRTSVHRSYTHHRYSPKWLETKQTLWLHAATRIRDFQYRGLPVRTKRFRRRKSTNMHF